jgi:uncharacterized protein YoxC
MKSINRKLKSNRGEPLSVSMILWIAIAVMVVLILASILIPQITDTGHEVADCIDTFTVDPVTGVVSNTTTCAFFGGTGTP